MKKLTLLGILVLAVAACDKSPRACKTEMCNQCVDACIVSCIEQAGESERTRCETSCQCTCTKVEDGKALGTAIQECL